MEVSDNEAASFSRDSSNMPRNSTTPYAIAVNCKKKAAHVNRPIKMEVIDNEYESFLCDSQNMTSNSTTTFTNAVNCTKKAVHVKRPIKMEVIDNESASFFCDSPSMPSNSSTPYTNAVNFMKKAAYVKCPIKMEVSDSESASFLRDSPSSSTTPYTDAVNSMKKAAHVKYPNNPFMVWSQIERRKIVSDHPDMDDSAINRQLGSSWEKLNDDQRQYYSDYLNMQKNSIAPYTAAVKCKKKPAHVKRPMNPFMIWSQVERRKIVSEHPGMHNSAISRQLGLRWKNLDDHQRKLFIKEAERLRQLHELEFPDYKYQPKKKLKGDFKNKNGAPLDDSKESLLNQQKKLLPKVISSVNDKMSPTMPYANLERKLLTGKNVSKQQEIKPKQREIKPKQGKNRDESLSGFAAMAKRLQTKDTSSCDQSKPAISIPDSNSLEWNTFSFSLYENELASKNAPSRNDIDKSTTKDKSSIDKNQSIIIDQKFCENLKGTEITQLDKVTQNILSSPNKSAPVEKLKVLPKNTGPKKPKSKSRLYNNRNLTSGPICFAASTSEDCLETFDYLTDKNVRKNAKHAEAKIKKLAEEYQMLLKSNNSVANSEYDFPEGDIPPLSELLGSSWSESELKFKMP